MKSAMPAAPTISKEPPGKDDDGAPQGTGLKRQRTRRRILHAAFALIGNEHGRGVRIEEICTAAQISRGSFYNYFASMEELFAALAFDISHDFNTAVVKTTNRIIDCPDRVGFSVRYYLDRARTAPEWGWAMVNLSASGPLFGAETSANALQTVEEGIARAEFRLDDARAGRDLILGATLASMRSLLSEEAPHKESTEVVRLVLRALGVRESKINKVVSTPLPTVALDARE